MNKKLKLVQKFAVSGVKKIGRREFTYRDRSVFVYPFLAGKYLVKNGPKKFTRRVKDEIIQINRRSGPTLAFPNGLVTGINQHRIDNHYKNHGRPVTVIIPSYNDLNVLVPCLESIKTTTDPSMVKVIVVDDYCVESHRKELKLLENEQVSVIFRKKNGGFAKAVNTGIKAANSKLDVVLVNSDIVAHKGWIEALQFGAYEFSEKVGIVGPKLLYPDGRIQSAGSHRNTEVPDFFDHYYRFQDSNYGPANIPQYCIGVTGACMYVTRKFINKVGILDEGFNFAFEDMDWCIRGWNEGFKSLYFPSATLTHVESATRPKNKKMPEKEKQSVEYFWSKWRSWFDERNVLDPDGKKKIIFVLQSFGLSGGIKNIFELANKLYLAGFNVEIWGLDSNPPAWPTEKGLQIKRYKDYPKLIKALSSEQAIKVATWWETAFPVWLSSVNKGVPVYFISEFETWFYPNDVVAQASVVSCYRKEFRNITISPYNLDELKSIGLDAKIIPCGYNSDLYRPLAEVKREENVLLAVGRTFFQKNFEMTFKAWNALGNKKPKMWLYGFEPEIAKRDNKIKYFVKPSNEEVNELYNKGTVFMQTSRHEGFCLPVLEAMAAGCPVITTDSHGNRGFCFDEKNCLMVEQDDIVGASKAIDRLFSDKKLREKLAKAALKTAEEYRWEVITEKAKQFFDTVK